jgi:serine protease AprX
MTPSSAGRPRRRRLAAALVAGQLSFGLAGAALGVGAPSTLPPPVSELVSLTGGAPAGPSAPTTMLTAATTIGADRYWAKGITGAGVDVAVVDSGVTPVPGLDSPGKVVHAPDFSGEASDPALADLDVAGHGTHIAGIIAGNDPATGYSGIAPAARIVSVKIADADGTTDVGRVLRAIMWVVEHKDDPGVNIRVLNLSLGGITKDPYEKSVLSAAVEKAWDAGIVVVAAAGNEGAQSKQLNDPAYDPYVLAVGASDSAGTPEVKDDDVAVFSSAGTSTRQPDVLAPGVRVQGLRVPGSLIDAQAPSANGSPFLNGSGTSQAAAIVSGAAALVLQQHPAFTPDDVKDALVSTTVKVHKGNADQGQQQVQLAVVAGDDARRGAKKPQKWKSTKVSDKELAEALAAANAEAGGTVHDAGLAWNGVRWNGVRWNGVRWNGVRWNGSGWD